MSRRFHVGILNKKNHEDMKVLSLRELQLNYGDEEGVEISRLSKEVFTIGKSFDDSFLKKFSTPAFDSQEVNDSLNREDSFYLINQEGLKALIENFRERIAEHFKELLGNNTQESEQSLQDARFSYIYFRLQEWGNDLNIKPYNLEGESVTNSSNLEYLIFELIRVYKSIDWDAELISITAW